MQKRFEFYNMLIVLLDNQVQLNVAVEEMYEIFSDQHRRNIVGIVCQDCAMGLAEGRPISSVLQKWVSYDEYSLIKAGEESGQLQNAFRKAMKMLDNKKRILTAIASCTLYPAFLGVQATYLLWKVSNDLIPKLGRSSNEMLWDSSAKLLKSVSIFVVKYGAISLTISIIIILSVLISLPLLNGRVRYYLDKIPPWNLYRALYGSTFLQNVGVLLSSNVSLPRALETMRERASPWLLRRIDDTLHGVNIGKNLGDALHLAGHDFPDRTAIQLLRVISGHRQSEKVIEDFGERWIESSIEKLKKTAKVLLVSALIINGGIMLLVLFGASGMQDGMLSGVRN